MSHIVRSSRNSRRVGAKAAGLARLSQLGGISVPPYFVVGTSAYDAAVAASESAIRALEREPADGSGTRMLTRAIRKKILSTPLSPQLAGEITGAYRALSRRFGEEASLVSVRSSATAEDGVAASFAGQYRTFVNIRGEEAVLRAVRQVWASTFSAQAVCYRRQHLGPRHSVSMAVIVQRMVEAAAGGTIYTLDPETGAPMICVNAVSGLGVADVSGECTPTSWVIDPRTMTVIKRRLARGVSSPIEPSLLLELTRQVERVATRFRDRWGVRALELEYALDPEGILYFTQVRPETAWSQGRASLTAVDLDRVGHMAPIYQGGMTGCPGVAAGVLRVVGSLFEAEAVTEAGDILVTPNTTHTWESLFGRIGGIVTEIGGTGSHTAVVMCELGKPALVGAARAMQSLAYCRNHPVTLDATQRLVFAGTHAATVTHRLTTLVPVYGRADQQSEEAAWAEASTQPGRTFTDSGGRRWILKPDYPVCRFTQSVFVDAHRWIGARLGVPVVNEVRSGVHQVAFSDVLKWRTRLRGYSLTELERLEEERESVMANYLRACQRLEPEPGAIRDWLGLYIRMNAFMGLAFDI